MRGATTLGEYKGRATATSVVGLCLGAEALSRRLVECCPSVGRRCQTATTGI